MKKYKADDPEIDIFMGAWGTGTNPSPFGLYSETAEYQLLRYTSEELETLLMNIDSKEAFDAEYRARTIPCIPRVYGRSKHSLFQCNSVTKSSQLTNV